MLIVELIEKHPLEQYGDEVNKYGVPAQRYLQVYKRNALKKRKIHCGLICS